MPTHPPAVLQRHGGHNLASQQLRPCFPRYHHIRIKYTPSILPTFFSLISSVKAWLGQAFTHMKMLPFVHCFTYCLPSSTSPIAAVPTENLIFLVFGHEGPRLRKSMVTRILHLAIQVRHCAYCNREFLCACAALATCSRRRQPPPCRRSTAAERLVHRIPLSFGARMFLST